MNPSELIRRLLLLSEQAVNEALTLDYDDPEDRYIWRELQELRPLALSALAQCEPVPVSERLPGAEDCMDEGWAWFYTPRGDWIKAVLPVSPAYTHWLPAHAIPLPRAGEGEG